MMTIKKEKVKDLSTCLMELYTLDSGSMIKRMAMATKCGLMVQNMKEIGSKTRLMATVN